MPKMKLFSFALVNDAVVCDTRGERVLDPSAFGSSPYQGEQFREGFMKPYDEYPLSLGRGLG